MRFAHLFRSLPQPPDPELSVDHLLCLAPFPEIVQPPNRPSELSQEPQSLCLGPSHRNCSDFPQPLTSELFRPFPNVLDSKLFRLPLNLDLRITTDYLMFWTFHEIVQTSQPSPRILDHSMFLGPFHRNCSDFSTLDQNCSDHLYVLDHRNCSDFCLTLTPRIVQTILQVLDLFTEACSRFLTLDSSELQTHSFKWPWDFTGIVQTSLQPLTSKNCLGPFLQPLGLLPACSDFSTGLHPELFVTTGTRHCRMVGHRGAVIRLRDRRRMRPCTQSWHQTGNSL
jgi:hypothetical protein